MFVILCHDFSTSAYRLCCTGVQLCGGRARAMVMPYPVLTHYKLWDLFPNVSFNGGENLFLVLKFLVLLSFLKCNF